MTEEVAPTEDEPTEAGLVDRLRDRAVRTGERAVDWSKRTAPRRRTFDLAQALYGRDRDTFASVLGSAIALRLFLFSTALLVAFMSLVKLLFGASGLENLMVSSGVSGQMADEVRKATETSTGWELGLFVSSAAFTIWAGRGLTLVLSACSAGAWQLDARNAKATVRVIGRITAVGCLIVFSAGLLGHLRQGGGVALATGSVAMSAGVLGVGWFVMTWALPKATRDPGAMLPGALVFAGLMTCIQLFMHVYLPMAIDNASETMGSIGLTVASLGYLFAVGRVMAGCIVLNAVLWEKVGSISIFVFSLPLVRRLPARFPWIARFFDLDRDELGRSDDQAAAAEDAPVS
ncbi:MAG: hypothetical protein U0P45_12320 [Acidimicrobiales bacterium]